MGVGDCTQKRSSLCLILVNVLLAIYCAGQSPSQCGRKDKVQMTVMSFKPQNAESTEAPLPHYECYLGAEDGDADVSSSRPYRTRNVQEPQPSNPDLILDSNLPAYTAAYNVSLDPANSNAFGIFTCNASKEGRQNTTIFTIFLRSNGYIYPTDELLTKTVNIGDRGVTIDMTIIEGIVDIPTTSFFSSNPDIRWRINGSGNINIPNGGDTDYVNVDYDLLRSRSITVNDEGAYEAHGKGLRKGQHALQRLIVYSCVAGRWGPPGCNGICDSCYNGGVCDDETGRCICPPGFMGDNCLAACGANRFGYSCEFQCDYGGNTDCIGRQFCLLDPYGCTCNTGYKDLDCMTECEDNKYGAGCLQQCHCDGSQGRCNRFTGVCNSGRCQSGWSGSNCQIPEGDCPEGYFGSDCTEKCLCINNVECDRDTGECINGVQCAPGAMKPVGSVRCQECPDGFYGNSCDEECHCSSDACDKATGECVGCCKPQWLDTESNTCEAGIEGSSYMTVNSGQSTTVRCDVSQSISSLYRTELSRERDSIMNSGIRRGGTTTIQGSSTTDFTINNASSTDVFYCLLVSNIEPVAWLNTTFVAYELPVLTDPPTAHRLTNDSITIRWRNWDEIEDVGDPPVVSYVTYYKEEAADMWMRGSDMSPDETPEFVASDLKMDVNYTFAVAVVRDGVGGEGPRGPPLIAKTLCGDPEVPINVQATLTDDNKVQVSWEATPGSVCSTGTTSFIVYAQKEGSNDEPIRIATVGGEMTSYIIEEGLEDGVSYTFLVSSSTDREGARSTRSEAVMYIEPIDSSHTTLIIIIVVISVVFLLAIVVILSLVVMKRRRKTAPPLDREVTAYSNAVSVPESPSVVVAGVSDSAGNSYEAVDRKAKPEPTKEIKVMPDKHKSAPSANTVYEVTGHNTPHRQNPTPPRQQSVPPPTKEQPEEQGDDFEEVLPSIGPKPTSDSEDIYANIPAPILVSSLPQYYQENEKSLGREFILLKKDQQAPWTVSVKPENKKKNRFKKMYTYDHSRVVLEKLPNDEHSDYYNASYVPDLAGKKSFIASQAPNTASVNDFWRMIWQEEISTVVMLTNLIENGKDRCFRYWPDEQGGSKVFGTVVVSWASTLSFADFVVRKFQVSQNGIIHDVHQVHYTTWPDMDVPSDATPLMQCIQYTKGLQKVTQSPLLCHCSAGVGRTGTFITLYCLMEVIKKEKKISIFEFVEKARKSRVNFVQTEKQYIFLYKFLVDYYLTRHTEIPAGLLANFNIKSKRSILSDEFQLLAQYTNYEASRIGDHDNNLDKIRFRDFVPNDRGLVFLMSEGAKSLSNYINATLFRSIRQTNAFISTQSPLPNTIEDMWRLVYDWQCPVIVMLNEINGQDGNCPQYWPDKGKTQYGNISVSFVERSEHPLFITRKFEVFHVQQTETRHVHQFQITSWPKDADLSAVTEIMGKVHELCHDFDVPSMGPVLVHCIDGVSRSGVFVAANCVLEQKKARDTVDVFSVVRQMRQRNSHVIKTEEEYILIYQILQFILTGDTSYYNI